MRKRTSGSCNSHNINFVLSSYFKIFLNYKISWGVSASVYETLHLHFHLSELCLMLDGTEVVFPDAQPFVDKRDRTLVPIRFVSEQMGASVDWEQDAKTAVIKKDKDTIRYTIGSLKAFLNNDTIVFDSFGIIRNDRTLVPLRFISEMLACDVDWDKDTKTVTITSPGDAVRFPEP